MTPHRSRLATVAALGTSQTLAWGSSYYLPAILATPISVALGVPRAWIFGAFSMALLIAALAAPIVGRAIDRQGGRGVLVLSNVVLAAGLIALGLAGNVAAVFVAWAILGVGMALGLYDAAFASLTALYGMQARGPITGITLVAGFASTVSWPLTTALVQAFGWREACLAWAALNLLLALPLNRAVLPGLPSSPRHARDAGPSPGWTPAREMTLLAFTFSAAGFVTGAMGAHLPGLLERAGATPLQAVGAAALLGPAQVAARFAEFFVMRRAHPLVSARLALALHPLGAAALIGAGAPAAALFVVLYGAGNGLVTIARGTLPLAILGARGYGARTGLLAAPSRLTQALAPLGFGLLVDRVGSPAVILSGALCVAALIALAWLREGSAHHADA